jgi:hypothetical protein
MVTVKYEGDAGGVRRLAQFLTSEGLEVRYEPPMETRSVGQDVVIVVLYLGDKALDEAIGVSVGELARKAVQSFKARYADKDFNAEVHEELDI